MFPIPGFGRTTRAAVVSPCSLLLLCVNIALACFLPSAAPVNMAAGYSSGGGHHWGLFHRPASSAIVSLHPIPLGHPAIAFIRTIRSALVASESLPFVSVGILFFTFTAWPERVSLPAPPTKNLLSLLRRATLAGLVWTAIHALRLLAHHHMAPPLALLILASHRRFFLRLTWRKTGSIFRLPLLPAAVDIPAFSSFDTV